MFIRNIESINQDNVYKCNKVIGRYIVSKGIPLLSMDGNKMVFALTDELKEVLDKKPILLHIAEKVGERRGK